jgi:hypothetical protein
MIVSVSSDMNAADRDRRLLRTAAISRIPAVEMPIIERKTK